MVPAVDRAVNDGACSPIKGMRKFLTSALFNGLLILPPSLNKFVNENIFDSEYTV